MRIWFCLFVVLAGLAGEARCEPQPIGSREDAFKAAYLFNFLKFVDWPPSVPADVLTVCFVGAEGVYGTLAPDIQNKRAAARRLVLRRLEPGADTRDCHVLYVDAPSLASVRSIATTQPMLTITDGAGFADGGAIIELFTVDNRLKFNINVSLAQKQGLRISSNLLQLAAQVRKGESS